MKEAVWFNNYVLAPKVRWPQFGPAIEAVQNIAIAVVRGGITEGEVIWRVRQHRAVRVAPADVVDGFALEMRFLLRQSCSDLRAERARAERAMQRQLAPLLDRRAPDAALRAAVLELNGGLFHLRELRALIETEKAWWVRLHVALSDQEAAHAA